MASVDEVRETTSTETRDRPVKAMRPLVAAILAFGSSAAVLILEVLAVRLVAPYIGINLQVNSAVIGTALAAIALGAWLGGRAADRIDPRALVGWMLLTGGVAVLLILPVVRTAGRVLNGTSPVAVIAMAGLAVFVPAALLSTVSPLVVKLQLRDLHRTGRIVGKLSSIGTLGGILATFVTGFVLVASLPTSSILLALGAVLVLAGIVCEITFRRRSVSVIGGFTVLAVVSTGLTLAVPKVCDSETTYNCANVISHPGESSIRVLKTSNAEISHVDLNEPTNLSMGYVQAIASAADLINPGGHLDGFHIGGGGMTLPDYLQATRPSGDHTIYEIDQGLTDLAHRELGFRETDRVRVVTGDGRLGLQQQPDASQDLVVEDAFGAYSPPWHLTTAEVAEHAQRVLRPDGLYAINMIDFPPTNFARSEIATLRSVFEHVVVVTYDSILKGAEGGNVVAIASDRPIPVEALQRNVSSWDESGLLKVADERKTAEFAAGGTVLTDDFAPVDQLITVPFEYW